MHSEEVRRQNRAAAAAGRQQGELFRLRVAYKKGNRLGYLGHLEVLNTVLASIRRSKLPFAVGNGFTRRVRVQFSQALPVGASSDAEYYDLLLTRPVAADEALERLRAATPPALAPYQAAYVGRRLPALEAWLNRSRWEALLQASDASSDQLAAALQKLADRGELSYLRGEREKHVDLTRCLVGWSCTDVPEGVRLRLETRATEAASLRPAILIDAAFKEPELAKSSLEGLRVCRRSQLHEDPDGALVEAYALALDPALLV